MLSPSGEQNYYGLEGEWVGHVTTPLQVKILFYNISPTSPSSHPSTLGAGVPRSKYMPLCILSLVVKIGWSFILVAHLLCRWVCLWTIYIYIYMFAMKRPNHNTWAIWKEKMSWRSKKSYDNLTHINHNMLTTLSP